MCDCLFKIGISANHLKNETQVAYKAAWHMLPKISKASKRDSLTDLMSGHIEVDETYFGGRQKGKRGRGAAGKTPVIGLIQRNGSVRTIAIPNVKSATLQALIKEHVVAGSTIYIDKCHGYRGLDNSGYSHKLVYHDKVFVSSKGNHTNSIEGYWRLSKHKIYARYHKISPEQLPDYLAESEFKFNERAHPDFIKLVLSKLLFQYLSGDNYQKF